MSRRVTVPEGHVAIVVREGDAARLRTMLHRIRRSAQNSSAERATIPVDVHDEAMVASVLLAEYDSRPENQ